ncbi:MAG: ATP-binding protein [Bacteriovorax sp.]
MHWRETRIINSFNTRSVAPDGKFRDILRALDESSIVAFTDVKGDITYVNDKFCEVCKYSRAELIGQNHRIIKSGHHSREFFADLWKTILSGKVWKGEIKNHAKDGTHYWVFTTIVPFLNEHGKPYQFVSIRTEITELKRIEEERDRAQLETARVKREEELREEFVATLSHDLRTPLTVALLSVQLIERNLKDPEKIKSLTASVANSINRVDGMITDLLDANKIRAGQKPHIDIKECDMEKVISKTLLDLTAIYGNRFILKSNGSLKGYWSPSGLKRIAENLCINAIKYGRPLYPVTITLIGMENQVELSVHNFGNGISDEEKKRLFDYLHRSSSAQGMGEKGWGIGLTLVKGMAEAHGGTVDIRSTSEKGTTFIVTLPTDAR